jgi:hypothetical protein
MEALFCSMRELALSNNKEKEETNKHKEVIEAHR